MIIVTGGAGFIGSNIIKELNAQGYQNILAVDDLTDGTKFANIVDCTIADYLDKADFLARINNKQSFTKQKIEAIIHQGACSTTTEWNGQFMLQNNYEYSKVLLHYCLEKKIPFLYASSAAVYGDNLIFKEDLKYEKPINVYGYSKFLFDQYVRQLLPQANSQVVGLRYFNVYGPREQHKASMASVAYHLNKQLINEGIVRLFEGSDGYGPGEQRRDFIYIDDVVKVNLWLLSKRASGIYNVGTGRSQTFNDVAQAVMAWHKRGEIKYIPFPDHLRNHYQSFTQADISRLRHAGYSEEFKTVAEGVNHYLDCLNKTAISSVK